MGSIFAWLTVFGQEIFPFENVKMKKGEFNSNWDLNYHRFYALQVKFIRINVQIGFFLNNYFGSLNFVHENKIRR